MYLPAHFAADDATTHALLTGCPAGDLVTATPEGPVATFLPLVFHPEVGERGAFRAHMARVNDHWRRPALGEALLLLRGPDFYVTPSWYPSKAEHGRVVPTWNYVVAHVHGRLSVHDDAEWLAAHARALTARHEAARERPWSVDDAPERFVTGQLRAVVGVELLVTRVEAKVKLSQNKPAADRAGVAAGLAAEGATVLAEAVRDAPATRA